MGDFSKSDDIPEAPLFDDGVISVSYLLYQVQILFDLDEIHGRKLHL